VAGPAPERARELGAEHAILSATNTDPAPVIHDLTGGGAQVSLDALGSPGTLASSVRSLRRRGPHVQVGLFLGTAATPPVLMDLVIARGELEIYGSHGLAAGDYPALLARIADGTLDPARLVGRVIGLDQAGAALAAMDGRVSAAGMTVVEI
jgi:threonine dehydrogenase-like Zn-dependent dehydrogenase